MLLHWGHNMSSAFLTTVIYVFNSAKTTLFLRSHAIHADRQNEVALEFEPAMSSSIRTLYGSPKNNLFGFKNCLANLVIRCDTLRWSFRGQAIYDSKKGAPTEGV